jgi:beta-mannan synthase
VQLWCRCASDIWRSALPLTTKLELLVLYFGLRKFATHWVSLGFFCTLVPLTVFTPEARPRPGSPSVCCLLEPHR